MRSVRRIAGCVTTGAGYAPAGRNAELQQVGPGGGLLSDWRSQDPSPRPRPGTGDIAWKLGGTTTPDSLKVKDDPRSYPSAANTMRVFSAMGR